jgi:hypothetical protein
VQFLVDVDPQLLVTWYLKCTMDESEWCCVGIRKKRDSSRVLTVNGVERVAYWYLLLVPLLQQIAVWSFGGAFSSSLVGE